MYSIGRDGNIIEVIREKHFIVEVSPYHFVTDASDINFRVGFAPRRIRTNLGNKQDFVFSKMDEEHRFVVYKQLYGCLTLKVYND